LNVDVNDINMII